MMGFLIASQSVDSATVCTGCRETGSQELLLNSRQGVVEFSTKLVEFAITDVHSCSDANALMKGMALPYQATAVRCRTNWKIE